MIQEKESVLLLRKVIQLDHSYIKYLSRPNLKDSSKSLLLEPAARFGNNAREINPYEWIDVDGESETEGTDQSLPSVDADDIALQYLLHNPAPHTEKQANTDDTVTSEAACEDENGDEQAKWLTEMKSQIAGSRFKLDWPLFNRILNYLERDNLAEMVSQSVQSCKSEKEKVVRQIQLEKLAKKLRIAFASAHWRMNICGIVHCVLLEHLPHDLLINYLRAFRILLSKKKVSSLLGELNRVAGGLNYVTRFSFDHFNQLIHSDTFDMPKLKPTVELTWPQDMPRPTLIVLSFPLRATSQRLSHFLSLLSPFCSVLPHRQEDDTGGSYLKARLNNIKRKLLTKIKSGGPVFVVSWDWSSLLAMVACLQLSRHEAASGLASATPLGPTGLICLGLPVQGVRGVRTEAEDPLLELNTPTLVLVGENSMTGPPEEVERVRERMRGNVSLIRVGGCDHLLRLTQRWATGYRTSQKQLDALIAKEMLEFMQDRVRSSLPAPVSPVEPCPSDVDTSLASSHSITPIQTSFVPHWTEKIGMLPSPTTNYPRSSSQYTTTNLTSAFTSSRSTLSPALTSTMSSEQRNRTSGLSTTAPTTTDHQRNRAFYKPKESGGPSWSQSQRDYSSQWKDTPSSGFQSRSGLLQYPYPHGNQGGSSGAQSRQKSRTTGGGLMSSYSRYSRGGPAVSNRSSGGQSLLSRNPGSNYSASGRESRMWRQQAPDQQRNRGVTPLTNREGPPPKYPKIEPAPYPRAPKLSSYGSHNVTYSVIHQPYASSTNQLSAQRYSLTHTAQGGDNELEQAISSITDL